MSGEENYYYQRSSSNYQYGGDQQQQWNFWPVGQEYAQNYATSTSYHESNPSQSNHSTNNYSSTVTRPPTYHNSIQHDSSTVARPTNYHNSTQHGSSSVTRLSTYHNSTQYSSSTVARPSTYHNSIPQHSQRNYDQRSRYSNSDNSYGSRTSQNWQRNSPSQKRHRLDSADSLEPKTKSIRRKKKPLSQNIPSKKGWTMDEAENALTVEKEYNKRYKNQSLIIKFPDEEVNKDIVQKFHSAIDTVHFQQPSTPRFCFVTLQETADADSVIIALNKQKFGHGFLVAEHKKDREEDQSINATDIDPLTLYVGNLAQEITKEDVATAYPRSRRIDIGYAKRMKHTRYAFVTFSSVQDTVEAFKNTHSTQMYSKSLIVRFRRLHGTIGMPGEPKPQNPPRRPDKSPDTTLDNVETTPTDILDHVETIPTVLPDLSCTDEPLPYNLELPHTNNPPMPENVKKEPVSPARNENNLGNGLFQECQRVFNKHKPKVEPGQTKPEVKIENDDDDHYPYGDEYHHNHTKPIFKRKETLEGQSESSNDKCTEAKQHTQSKLEKSVVKQEDNKQKMEIKDEPTEDEFCDTEFNDNYSETDDSDQEVDLSTVYEKVVNTQSKMNYLKKNAP